LERRGGGKEHQQAGWVVSETEGRKGEEKNRTNKDSKDSNIYKDLEGWGESARGGMKGRKKEEPSVRLGQDDVYWYVQD
jgi:hypothetical protein